MTDVEGGAGQHRAHRDARGHAGGDLPPFIPLVTFATDACTVAPDAGVTFFPNGDRTAAPDRHRAFFANHHAPRTCP